MMISILGCGWYGKALATALLKKGVIVKGSTTLPGKLEDLRAIGVQQYIIKFGPGTEVIDPDFFECDILVISIPPKLKSGSGQSYLSKIQRIIKTCVQYEVNKVIYISSTGVYGDHNSEVNELTDPNPDIESERILFDAEKLIQKEQSFKTTIIRFGGLIGPGRHPGRFFAGKTNIPNGMAPVNLIHLQDCARITMAVIEQSAFGYLFNAVSPDHPAKADYYREMSLRANLQAPGFVNELKNWKVVNSINLARILKYVFVVDDLTGQSVDL